MRKSTHAVTPIADKMTRIPEIYKCERQCHTDEVMRPAYTVSFRCVPNYFQELDSMVIRCWARHRAYAAQRIIMTVSSPVKVISTLWPQRAINSSMFGLLVIVLTM
jgi:L-asparaginase II